MLKLGRYQPQKIQSSHLNATWSYTERKGKSKAWRILDHIGESISESPTQKVQMKNKSSYLLKRPIIFCSAILFIMVSDTWINSPPRSTGAKTLKRLYLFYSAAKIIRGLQKYTIEPSFREWCCSSKTCYSSTTYQQQLDYQDKIQCSVHIKTLSYR